MCRYLARLRLILAASPLLFGLAAAPAVAQTSWTGGTGSWFGSGNWSGGVPSAATPLTTVGNGGDAQINGAANAGSSLVINGGSTVDLQSGGTLTAGAITVGANGTLQFSGSTAVTGPVTDNGALNFVLAGNATYAGALSGGGSLAQNGLGNLTLSGANAGFSGPVTINAGSLTLGSTHALGTASVLFAGNNTALNATATSIVSGNITATGSATFGATGGNTLTLLPSTVSFATTVHFGSANNTGTVVMAPAGILNPPVTVSVDGGTLVLGSSAGSSLLSHSALTVGSGVTPATLDLFGFNATVLNLSGTSAGTITNSGGAATLTTFNVANSTFAGVIQDNGSGSLNLQVAGAGGTTLTLTGANTYTGGTTIASGQTLQLGNGGATGSIVGNVTNNDTLTFDRSDVFTFGGAIAGAGTVQQNGPGTTILTNTNTYGGATSVNAGTLEVDGSIANSTSVTVNSGGQLSGTGLIDPATTTTIMGGGTLAPGNAASPIGALTIAGNLAFQSGAIYLIQVSSAGAASTSIGGAASLAGTVQVAFTPGSFAKRSYDILHASGGLGGTTFSGLSFNDPNFAAGLSYSATDVFLNLTSALGAGTSLNQNQRNVANDINGIFNAGGTLPANFTGIFGLSGGGLANALTQLDGEAATGGERAAFQLTNEFLELMLDPFVDGRGNAGGGGSGGGALGFAPDAWPSLPPEIALAYDSIVTKAPPPQASLEQRWTAWGSAYGGANNADGNAVVGSNNITTQTLGFAGGMDYHVTADMVAGFALAGAGTNWGLAGGLGSGRSDALQVGAYSISRFGPAYLAGALAFSNHWFTTNRTALGDGLSANFVGQSYGAPLEGGYRFALAPGLGVTPYGAVQLQDLHTPAYSETDLTGGGFGLSYAAMNATDLRTELGARFDDPTRIGDKPLILFGRLAWAHDFVDNPALSAAFETLPGGTFTVNGAAMARDSALTTAGAHLVLTPQWTLSAKFDGEFAAGAQTYAGSGTLRYTW